MRFKKSIATLLLAFSAFLLPACELYTDGNGGNNDGNHGEHVDANNDGECDTCFITVAYTFDFYAVNDLHGKFDDGRNHPGVDELSTYLNNRKAKNENTVLLSSGDMWQGAAASNLTKGHIVTDWMNEMDFVSMTLGNHEYDWGESAIVSNAALAEFPILAINAYNTTTNQRVSYAKSSVTVEKNGVKIGIIGAIGDCLSSISGDMTKNLTFKTGSELANLVKAESTKLRQEGADFIVYSLHDGGEDGTDMGHYATELSSGGYVDLVFEGHSHSKYVSQDGYGVYHLQGGGDNKGISHAQVKINYVTGSTQVIRAEFISTSTYQNLADDPVVENLKDKYATQIAPAYEVLGQNASYRSGSSILETCAALYAKKGEETWGEDYDIVLGGGYMNTRAPYNLYAGQVLYGDLMDILPFDNQLVLCSIKGKDLKSNFINTSKSTYYIGYTSYGSSVKNSIVDSATYYIVTDTYSSTYAPNKLTEIERYPAGTYARDLLADYIRAGNYA